MKFRNTLTAVLALAAGIAGAPAAYAIEGYSYPWQMGLQPANSASMEGIHSFHNGLLLPIITEWYDEATDTLAGEGQGTQMVVIQKLTRFIDLFNYYPIKVHKVR